jgi:hypothetical protein
LSLSIFSIPRKPACWFATCLLSRLDHVGWTISCLILRPSRFAALTLS